MAGRSQLGICVGACDAVLFTVVRFDEEEFPGVGRLGSLVCMSAAAVSDEPEILEQIAPLLASSLSSAHSDLTNAGKASDGMRKIAAAQSRIKLTIPSLRQVV